MSIHFTAKQMFEDGCVRLNWCKMNFKPDLIRALEEYGMIPKQNTLEVLKLMKEHMELTKKFASESKSEVNNANAVEKTDPKQEA